jgi:16S rRNA processing protein RimM
VAGAEGDFLIVGAVQKPHGIKGELYVRLETDHPEDVFAAGRVIRVGDAEGRPLERSLTIERARPFKGGMLVKAAEIGPRDPHGRESDVDALRGLTLLIPRGEARPLDEDEVFLHQLVGLRVVADEGAVGRVRELYDAPSGFLLVVEREGRGELLIPFVKAMVRRIDVEAGVLELEAPPGLLEL